MGACTACPGRASRSRRKNPPDTSKAIPFSDFTRSGALGLPEVVGPIFDEINQKYGTNVEPIFR